MVGMIWISTRLVIAVAIGFFAAWGSCCLWNMTCRTVLAPAHVSVPSAPETGLAILIGSPVAVSLFPGVLMDGTIPVEWYTARRKTAVDYDSWLLKGAGMADMTLTMDQAGIFALKARAICVCQSNEVEYVHMNSEPAVLGIDDELGPNEAGVQVPVVHVIDHSILPEGRFPPTANEWATGSIPIAGWVHLGHACYPEPGMIAGHPNTGGMGHCGIVDYDGWTISAR